MKKLLAVGIILLLVCVSVPSTGRVMEQTSTMSSDGKTWYVGGSGPGNYSSIQYAVNQAKDGDTVFVYNGTYTENVEIKKSINVIGEDKNTTFVNWKFEDPYITFLLKVGNIVFRELSIRGGMGGIFISSSKENQVHISNICIEDCNIIDTDVGWGGLVIQSGWGVENVSINRCYFDNDYDVAVNFEYWGGEISNISFSQCRIYEDRVIMGHIKNLKITDCEFIISKISIGPGSENVQFINCTMESSPKMALTIESYQTTIENCTITNSSSGAIYLDDVSGIRIYNCFIKNYEYEDAHGVILAGVNNFLMEKCIIENMFIAYYGWDVYRNVTVKNCHIANNKVGLQYFNWQIGDRFIENNFINNTKQFRNEAAWFIINWYNNNYWSDWKGWGSYHVYGFLNWDWNPVSEPYDIEV